MYPSVLDLEGEGSPGLPALRLTPLETSTVDPPVPEQLPLSTVEATIQVTARSEVRIPEGRALHAEALDPSIVEAYLVSPGIVGIRGVRPGDTTVLIITASDVLTWPVHVNPVPTPTNGPGPALAGWYQFLYLPPPLPVPGGPETVAALCRDAGLGTPSTFLAACSPSANSGIFDLTFQQGPVNADVASTGQFRLDAKPKGGYQFSASSLFQTPLVDFGVTPTYGGGIRTPWGLEALGTPLGAQVFQHIPAWHQDVFAGYTPLGPLAGVQIAAGPFSAHASALLEAGQVETAESVSVRAGDVSVSFYASPTSNGVIGRVTRRPLDFLVGDGSSGPQVGLGYALNGGQALQVLWSSASGFQISFTAPIGQTATSATVTPGQTQLNATLLAPGIEPAVVATGPATLQLTPTLPGTQSSVVRWTLPVPAPPPPATPLGPSSSAGMLIIRTCLDTRGDATCGDADPQIIPTVLIDGTPVPIPGGGIPVSPGQHVVAVPPEVIPPLLVPVRGLTCDVTIAASGVGICDLPFRHAGNP